MLSALVALVAAALAVLAFPPFGPGLLVVPGVALFLFALARVDTRKQGFWVGLVYGLGFFGGLMWWLSELEFIALALVPVQALFLAAYGWWLAGYRQVSEGRWLALAVGGWAFMEMIRYHFPVGGLEWGAVGYALSDQAVTRLPAQVVGTSGLTVLVVGIGAVVAALMVRKAGRATVGASLGIVAILAISAVWSTSNTPEGEQIQATVVQGSTPCPFEHCPPDERYRTYEQHLELTRALDPDTAGLVIWPESATGSTNADPVLNEEVRQSIADEARRLGSPMVIGGDRILSDTEWVNANVFFDAEGSIVGEYLKQHPVPFGEYIPLRPLFDWIPALSQVPRDMIPGDGPVLFGEVGSVISFEGGFSRYPLETRRAGAEVIIVNTNEASYGLTPAADQFIGMTRMRAVELGVPVIHAAVTGKSVFIDYDGELGPSTGLGTMEILQDTYRGDQLDTPYTSTGDLLMFLAAVAALVTWGFTLVGSPFNTIEED